MRHSLMTLCLLIVVSVPSLAAADGARVAVLRLEEVLQRAAFIEAAIQQLEAEANAVRGRLDDFEADLKNREKLHRTYADNDQRKLENIEEMDILKLRIKKLSERQSQRLGGIEVEIYRRAYSIVREQLDQYRAKQGYDFVFLSPPPQLASRTINEFRLELATHSLLANAPQHDITDAFLTWLNKQVPIDRLKAPPATTSPAPAAPTSPPATGSGAAIELPVTDEAADDKSKAAE